MALPSFVQKLREEQRRTEKQLWHALRAGRFAGFKFRRQHPKHGFILDFYCHHARLAIEMDGFHHGLPGQRENDERRTEELKKEGIEVLRFWNRHWRENREGVLFEIWRRLHARTGRIALPRLEQNHRYLPPDPSKITGIRSPLFATKERGEG